MTKGERDSQSLAAYGCLGALCAAGAAAGVGCVLHGVGTVARASGGRPRDASEARALLDSLEGAVLVVGVGTLCLLVAFVAAVLLLQELVEQAARRRRGPVRDAPP
ncbi:MAG: hypothetical protein D6731_10500 [Planctomycetota bacterium]|nr:MAG: hypothetical protein D6731_10500 [Planctomycetota bacterium]